MPASVPGLRLFRAVLTVSVVRAARLIETRGRCVNVRWVFDLWAGCRHGVGSWKSTKLQVRNGVRSKDFRCQAGPERHDMELRDYASRVLLATDLDEKLAGPESPLTDDEPGPPFRPELPGRPANLQFAARRASPSMPKPASFQDPARRGVAHHLMANHELQAAEVMAMMLLAFPEAPADFRGGLAAVLGDEQRHTKMHARRAAELGVPFGSLPVNGYIWSKSRAFGSVLDYLAGIPLTLEQRNLDHSLELESWFLAVGDAKGAAIVRTIHNDEIRHVAFGVEWLRRMKAPERSDFEAWNDHLHWPLRPEKAIGERFDRESRLAAGLDDDFLTRLEECRARTGGRENSRREN